jgi:hypothetical protein
MTPLPHLFLQLFELSNDHRDRRRLQPHLAIVSGSTSHQRPWIQGHRHLLNIVHHSIADNHHRSKLAVDHLDILAGLCLAGEPSLFLFISSPQICIARLRLDPITELVSNNKTAPHRLPSQPSQSNQSN